MTLSKASVMASQRPMFPSGGWYPGYLQGSGSWRPCTQPIRVPQRFLYRLYWRWTSVLSWLAMEPDVSKAGPSRQAKVGQADDSFPSCGPLGAGRRRSRERGRVGRRRAATARERCRVYGCFLHVTGIRARLHVGSRLPQRARAYQAAFNGPQTGVPIEHRAAIREVRSAALTRPV